MIDLIKRKGYNPLNKQTLYYPYWVKNQDTDSIKIAKLIAKAGAMSAGMTSGVLLDFPNFMINDLLDGKQINVIGLGTFKLKVTGKAKKTPEEVTATGLELDMVFEPDSAVLSELRGNAKYRFVKRTKTSVVEDASLDSSTGDYVLDEDTSTNTTVDTSTGTIDSSTGTIDTSTGSDNNGGDDIPAGNG